MQSFHLIMLLLRLYCIDHRYIKRRCQFLDNLPQYNYNQIVPGGNDTSKLGSTLMNAMLKEVPQFCDPSTKEDWSLQAHQQVINL